jgi:hypothetical protein
VNHLNALYLIVTNGILVARAQIRGVHNEKISLIKVGRRLTRVAVDMAYVCISKYAEKILS